MGGGTGWRRAFCTTIPRERDSASSVTDKQSPSPSPSPRIRTKFGFLSGNIGSNPSTPKLQSQPVSSPSLRCRTTVQPQVAQPQPQPQQQDSPKLQCKTTACAGSIKSPRFFQSSSNPTSPSRFSLFKTSLRLSKSSCGICLQNVKTGQGTAIFTAECSHAFHFPCIASHVRKNANLICPVCSSNWREVPLLAIHKNQPPSPPSPPSQDKLSKPTPDHRLYDDDEPLLSPTAAARFNPIPEEDESEEEEDEIQEFQGFFVDNPNSGQGYTDSGSSRNVEVKLLPVSTAVVSVGKTHETYVVALKIKAPPPPPPAQNSSTRRAPIDLVTVLDVSGSMIGPKLQMLKRAMRLVISSLGSADRLSIVAFSSSPKRLLPLRRMSAQGQRSARRLIDRLVCGQGSSVGDALRKATKVLEDRRERNPVASIMLLSNGHDDSSPRKAKSETAPAQPRHVSSTRFAHLEIPVHVSGVEDAFTKCVGGLLSVVVQDLRIQLGFSSGSAPAEITAVYSCNGRPTCLGSGSIRLGDLYAEEERELLVELRVPTVPVRAHHVLAVRCCHKDPSTQELIYSKDQTLLVPRPHTVRSSEPKVERLRSLFVTTRAIAEARRFIEQHNDLSNAYRLLSSARALLKQSSSISCDDYINGLESELKELQYRRQHSLNQRNPEPEIQRRRTAERETPTPTATATAYFDENGEPLTPTSAWRAAEQLAKVAIMRKSMNKVGDLHGFENARF